MKKYTFEDSRTVELFEDIKCGVIYSDMWQNFIAGEINSDEQKDGYCIHIYGPNTTWKRCHMGKNEKGVRGGYGIHYWPNDTVYMGNFKDYYCDGFGVIIQPTNNKFIGQFKPLFNIGLKGILSPCTAQGKWYVDEKEVDRRELGIDEHGFKRIDDKEIWIDGTYYQGEFKNGKYHGFGKLVLAESLYYEGNFRDGNYHGEGTYYYGKNGYMKGTFVDNDITGESYLKFDENRGYYKGNMKGGRPFGFGVLKWNDKIISGKFEHKILSNDESSKTTRFVEK